MKIVRDILERKGTDVWTIEPNATVREALEKMAEKDVGALVITDEQRVIGIISERDYARRVIDAGSTFLDAPVRDVMAHDPSCITPGHTVAECMSFMTDKRVRHLPVIGDGNSLAGLISIGDVVAATLSECESRVDELKSFVYGT
ncbi:MAG: putative signal transduction protein with domain [Chromatiaceae bacterium]|jgi:CBS domain-containing protein|nr:putative signal transduction protein with domain [Chromatiaceae bacterium]